MGPVEHMLQGALNFLSGPDKWCQGSYYTAEGKCCMLGSLTPRILGEYSKPSASEEILYETSKNILTQVCNGTPEEFNDAPFRTFEDVVEALTTARDLARLENI